VSYIIFCVKLNSFSFFYRFDINKRERSKTLGIAISKLLWKCGEADNQAFVCVYVVKRNLNPL
jgi:hypothetical protein